MKKKLLLLLCGIISLSTIIGCGKEEEEAEVPVDPAMAYISQMEDGMFYVKHAGTDDLEPVYFGQATFDQGDTTTEKEVVSHIMWFMDDYDKIPTLYAGDSLIMFTNGDLKEDFTFERFEDMGYSIGLCHLEPGPSGRYLISTDPNEKQTYPGSDADALLDFNNGSLIIDEIGGQIIREVDETQTSASWISKYGTVKNLQKDQIYPVIVYEGTKRSEIPLTANIRILGSMQGLNSVEYYFDTNNVINIKIPQEYNSGFYLINGLGLFRYINGKTYDDNDTAAYNIPNPDDVTFNTTTVIRDGIGYSSDGSTVQNDEPSAQVNSTGNDIAQKMTQKFPIKTPSAVSITISFDMSEYEPGHGEMTAKIIGPNDEGWSMDYDDVNNEFTKKIKAQETGDYKIVLDNLYGAKPEFSVSAKKIQEENVTDTETSENTEETENNESSETNN